MCKCLVILANGFEEIEALTVVDILRRGEVDVTIAGLTNSKIVGQNNITVFPDIGLPDVQPDNYDMLVLPGGGIGVDNIIKSPLAGDIIKKIYRESKYVTAICAAPMALAALDIISDKKVTSYPSAKEQVENKAFEYLEERVVVDGKVITSRGPGTAMDFSFTLLEILKGKDTSDAVSKGVLYT